MEYCVACLPCTDRSPLYRSPVDRIRPPPLVPARHPAPRVLPPSRNGQEAHPRPPLQGVARSHRGVAHSAQGRNRSPTSRRRLPLSANIAETPTPLGIRGRQRGTMMKADPNVGRGVYPSPRRPWGARPPGPRPRRRGALRTRRFSPSRPAAGSRPSIDCGSSRKRTAVASRARSAACCVARGCTARICRRGARPAVGERCRA